jgi:MSHA biogenesis protein MshN
MGGNIDRCGFDRIFGDCVDGTAMSVINQVLNQLEKRGAHSASEQPMVRAVPSTGRNKIIPLLVFGVVLISGVAVWQWAQSRSSKVSSVSNVAKAAVSSSSQQPEKLAQQHQAVDMVVPASGVSASSLPVSRLSFELRSVSLPSTLHPFDPSAGLATGIAQERPQSALVLVEDKKLSKIPDAPVKKAQKKENKKAKAKKKSKAKEKSKKIAKLQPMKTATSTAIAADQTSDDASPMKRISPSQKADAEFRKAVALMQQGRIADALAGYQSALRLDANHDAARQAMIALLLENKRSMEAERLLRERLKTKPDHTGFAMMLARLQVERGATAEATATLENALPYADSQADYQAFLAALLQRQNRHDDAIARYQIALRLAPNNGVWLMGYGISLQAKQRNVDAKDAYKRALDTQTLSPDLQAFVQGKIKEL